MTIWDRNNFVPAFEYWPIDHIRRNNVVFYFRVQRCDNTPDMARLGNNGR